MLISVKKRSRVRVFEVNLTVTISTMATFKLIRSD